MTPEQRAAAERVRRVVTEGQHTADMRIYLADLHTLAVAYIAEHLPDDDEPVTWALAGQLEKQMVCGHERVWINDGVAYMQVNRIFRMATAAGVRCLLAALGGR